MMRIYLSGPMTGLPDLNFAAFHAMTTNLRAGGHTVTNPAEINPDGGTWNDCMRRDIAALMDCDTVATLPGWEHSKGARLEVPISERFGLVAVECHHLVAAAIDRQLNLPTKIREY
ncbi:MAG: DUF4406 domain-containing protein [Gammaproteobacteria bacterium]